jgi:hypothetical protein
MATRIFNRQKIRDYTIARLLAKEATDSDLDNLKEITLEVGFGKDEFLLRHKGSEPIKQDFPREPIVCEDSHVFVPIYDGLSRFDRYNNMLDNLIKVGGCQNIQKNIIWYQNSTQLTTERFKEFAENVVRDIFSHNRNFDTLMIGPLRTAVDALFGHRLYKLIRPDPKDMRKSLEDS